jgi:hypothetical protein
MDGAGADGEVVVGGSDGADIHIMRCDVDERYS